MRIGRDGIAGLVGLAGSLGLLGAAAGLPRSPLVPIGPDFYPRLLFVATAALSAALVITDLAGRRRHRPPPARYRLVVLTFLIFGAYVAALPWLGYRLSTLLFVGGLQATLEPPRGRRWLVVAATAAVTTLLTYLIFERYLFVLLPRGRLTGF